MKIELALVKLYRVTGDRKYLELSRFFVDQRAKPSVFQRNWSTCRRKIAESIILFRRTVSTPTIAKTCRFESRAKQSAMQLGRRIFTAEWPMWQ